MERWEPPLDGEALSSLLTKVREWQAYDGEALLDDVAAVLDEVVPAEDRIDEFGDRLRGHLMQLVNIALAAEADQDEETARLIEQARTVRSEDVPGDHWKAVGHLRRMGWIVNELLEQLVATNCLKAAA